MLRILLSGAMGAMGKTVADLAFERENMCVVAGLGKKSTACQNFNVYSNISDIAEDFDVIIDFSNTSALASVTELAVGRKKPIVLATTGYTNEQIAHIDEISKIVPVFFSANMSLCVSLMRELCVRAFSVLGESHDVEIVEKHHRKKLDAPSGTALMLADAMTEELPRRYTYSRHDVNEPRPSEEIGIHSVRGGTIVGEHEVIFAGADEVLSIRHEAFSKRIFAAGALSAASFLVMQSSGMYGMKDLINSGL